MDGQLILASCKRATTKDITSGLSASIQSVLALSDGVQVDQIESVMIGTTQFLNAFAERRNLAKVAVIRIGLPMGDAIPPLSGWPEDLLDKIGRHSYMVRGGSYYNGKEYAELDEEAIRSASAEIVKAGVRSVAISAVFAPMRPDLEVRAAEIVRECIPDSKITLSHQVGGIGLIERENAAVINSALQDLSVQIIKAYRQTLHVLNLAADLYVSQNDGTLVAAAYVQSFPVSTCSAGSTNSLRGAAFLSGIKDGIVVDIGGTTSDLGVLINGFPRETSAASDIGGVRTNFSMPDVFSTALGGGTRIYLEDESVRLGPDSVGHQLLQRGLTFGGDVFTTTDLAVADGRLDIGDAHRIDHIPRDIQQQAKDAIQDCLEVAVDQMKTNASEVPLVLVGGGSILVGGELAGCSETIVPEHADVANAVGAAIGQIGGRFRGMVDYSSGRNAALDSAIEQAKQHAVSAGAVLETVKVLEVEEFPMTHMRTNSVEVRVRVVGDLPLNAGIDPS